MVTLRKALQKAVTQLSSSSSPVIDAEVLLQYCLKKNRSYLYAHPEEVLSEKALQAFQRLTQQRAEGIPVAYLTGSKEFWSLPLVVNEHTLIPRPATEKLVELTLELLKNCNSAEILDLGTGSGAIALALASERPQWHITACDKSKDALTVAQHNAQALGLTVINFYQSDWFKDCPQQKYHAIVSNPPYIAEHDPHLSQGDVRYEPVSALVSGADGLDDLRYLIQHSLDYLVPGGWLLLEHGFDQKVAISSILRELGYSEVDCWQDCQGNDRVSGGRRP